MNKAILYIHGKNGNSNEALHYKDLLPDYTVIGLDYHETTPWDTKEEFIQAYNDLSNQYKNISIIANSIGAYFAMNALSKAKINRAFFISPIVDMEKLIIDMMNWAGVTEKELADKGEIETSFGETLSWRYLDYVRSHPIKWETPTDILYGDKDNLISIETISAFARSHQATLTVMKNAEHWFHTDEQIKFIDYWLKKQISFISPYI